MPVIPVVFLGADVSVAASADAFGMNGGDGNDDILIHRNGGEVTPHIFQNQGSLTFAEVSATTDITDVHSVFGIWADVDNDGNQDLAMFFREDSNTNEPGLFTLRIRS